MLLKCYQQPDPNTILAVMNEPSKLGPQWDTVSSRGAIKRPATNLARIGAMSFYSTITSPGLRHSDKHQTFSTMSWPEVSAREFELSR
jgi:hypothetical protein